jgi:hypothetical protein
VDCSSTIKTQRLWRRIPVHSKFRSNYGGSLLFEIWNCHCGGYRGQCLLSDVTLPDSNSCQTIEQRNASTYKLEVQGKHKLAKFALCSLIFYAEDGGRMFLFNASILQIVYGTAYTKRNYSVCLTYIENQYLIEFPGVLLPSRES